MLTARAIPRSRISPNVKAMGRQGIDALVSSLSWTAADSARHPHGRLQVCNGLCTFTPPRRSGVNAGVNYNKFIGYTRISRTDRPRTGQLDSRACLPQCGTFCSLSGPLPGHSSRVPLDELLRGAESPVPLGPRNTIFITPSPSDVTKTGKTSLLLTQKSCLTALRKSPKDTRSNRSLFPISGRPPVVGRALFPPMFQQSGRVRSPPAPCHS